MKSFLSPLIGFALGFGGGVGLTLYQAHPVIRNGEQRYVVSWVRWNKVKETPVVERCLVVGLACGIAGGVIGSRIGVGAGVIATAVGAGLGLGGTLLVWGEVPNRHGTVGEQDRVLGSVLFALLGASLAASASAKLKQFRDQVEGPSAEAPGH
jgi:hypothetical protein